MFVEWELKGGAMTSIIILVDGQSLMNPSRVIILGYLFKYEELCLQLQLTLECIPLKVGSKQRGFCTNFQHLVLFPRRNFLCLYGSYSHPGLFDLTSS